MTPENPLRQPAGRPTGGEFATRERPDANITLPPARTSVDGWDLRNLRQSGMGSGGPAWSAVIHRHDIPAVVVTDRGDGCGITLESLDEGDALIDFRTSASRIIPADDGIEFARVLRAAAACDRMVQTQRMPRRECIELLVITGELQVQHRALLS